MTSCGKAERKQTPTKSLPITFSPFWERGEAARRSAWTPPQSRVTAAPWHLWHLHGVEFCHLQGTGHRMSQSQAPLQWKTCSDPASARAMCREGPPWQTWFLHLISAFLMSWKDKDTRLLASMLKETKNRLQEPEAIKNSDSFTFHCHLCCSW